MCALVTGVQTCALPISSLGHADDDRRACPCGRARRSPPCFRSRRSAMTTDYRMLDRVPGQRLMTVRVCDIERIAEYDPDPDLSYPDPDANPAYAAQNADPLAADPPGAGHCIRTKARAPLL